MASSRSTGNSVLHTTTSATDSVSCSTKEWSCAPRWPRLRAAFPTNAWDSPTHPGQVRRASPHQAPLDVAQRFPQRLHARSAVHQVGIQGRQRGRLQLGGLPLQPLGGQVGGLLAAPQEEVPAGQRDGERERRGGGWWTDGQPRTHWQMALGEKSTAPLSSCRAGAHGGHSGDGGGSAGRCARQGRGTAEAERPGEGLAPPPPTAPGKASPPGSAQQSCTGAPAQCAAATTFSAAGLPAATRSRMAPR